MVRLQFKKTTGMSPALRMRWSFLKSESHRALQNEAWRSSSGIQDGPAQPGPALSATQGQSRKLQRVTSTRQLTACMAGLASVMGRGKPAERAVGPLRALNRHGWPPLVPIRPMRRDASDHMYLGCCHCGRRVIPTIKDRRPTGCGGLKAKQRREMKPRWQGGRTLPEEPVSTKL